MATQLNERKSYLCKYKVENLVLIFGEKYLQMDPSNILSIEYLNDYEINIRSILKVSLRMDIRKKLWILKNKNTITAKFELVCLHMDLDTDSFIHSPKTIWNETFGVYFNEEDDSIDINVLEERLKLNEGNNFNMDQLTEENYFESQNILDIYLFNQKLLNASNRVFNSVFTKDIVQPMVGRILTSSKHKHVLMSKIENNKNYEEVLIPALPAYKALIYLDQYYGLYKTGAIIFYDVDYLYILNSNGKCTVKRKNEYPDTTILVKSIDHSSPGNGMIKPNPNEKVHYVSISDMDINTEKVSMSKNAKYGSEAKIVITDDITIDLAEADQSYMDQRNQHIIYSRKDDNRFRSSIIKARMEENEIIFYISGDNFDISAFTPNKTFHVVFEEASKQKRFGKYRYRLAYVYHFIRIEGEPYMSSSHQFILKRASNGK